MVTRFKVVIPADPLERVANPAPWMD